MNSPISCCGHTCRLSGKKLDARIPQNEIGHVYDKLAGIYDVWAMLTESRARKRAIELAKIENGINVLEVAVGTGLAFHEIVKRNANGKNTGIDISQGMLKKAEKRLKDLSEANYTLSIGSAFNLPIEDGSADVLMNNYMFDLMSEEDMDRALVEFKRVLKEGGRLVLINMTQGERLGSSIYSHIYNISPKAMGGCRGVTLSDRLIKHGFIIVTREYYQQMLFPSEVILAYK